jgi:hypothetical protein
LKLKCLRYSMIIQFLFNCKKYFKKFLGRKLGNCNQTERNSNGRFQIVVIWMPQFYWAILTFLISFLPLFHNRMKFKKIFMEDGFYWNFFIGYSASETGIRNDWILDFYEFSFLELVKLGRGRWNYSGHAGVQGKSNE